MAKPRAQQGWAQWCHVVLLVGLLVLFPSELNAATGVSSAERFIDGVMQRAIVQQDTVGATVALVQDGRLIVARGYGLADVEQQVPVESRVTGFRIGSISKVLIWISVLQMVEAGKLDLDTDVNQYLTKFQIPDSYSDPITLRHLMTHTPGFEDSLQGLFVSGPRQVGELAEALQKQMPDRVALPGSRAAYSNYGSALAAHIVSNVAGQSWDEYVENNILTPLNMTGASTRQPLPKAIEATRAKGYTRIGDKLQAHPYMYLPLAPAGASTANALDMAKLMVELLNPRSTSVLQGTSKDQLLSGAYVVHPLVNGMTLGMAELTQGGTRAVGHDGSTMLFNSLMVLWPDENMGLFVSTNTLGGGRVTSDLFTTLSAHLGFSRREQTLTPVESGAMYTGTYLPTRRNFSDITKLAGLTLAMRVDYDPADQSLLVPGQGGVKRFQRLEGHIFQQVNGSGRIGFDVDGGVVKAMFHSGSPAVSMLPARGMENPWIAVSLFVAWVALALGVLIVWPFSWLGHRRNSQVHGSILLTLIVLGSIVSLAALVMGIANEANDQLSLLLGGFDRMESNLWLALVFAVLGAVQLFYLYPVWVSGYWWFSRRFHFTLWVFVNLMVVWWLVFWNLFPKSLLELVA